jgi:hypothetical protein
MVTSFYLFGLYVLFLKLELVLDTSKGSVRGIGLGIKSNPIHLIMDRHMG